MNNYRGGSRCFFLSGGGGGRGEAYTAMRANPEKSPGEGEGGLRHIFVHIVGLKWGRGIVHGLSTSVLFAGKTKK